ncbi:uncharacterized protein LOC135075448 [Ostrinia nubilalis]|uniref:uncharacterized protein LOC135075448 n=1 Tax=Ostrinia nubilalis TaxID=29057 RepID=UPI003082240A
MNTDMDSSNADEYYVTALQIFDYCGAESSGTLRVDALMDKFAPFIKTNKAEYSYLKSLLDPGQNNPEVNVIILAKALHKYSESQKCKVDLDESFNLRCGQAPHDSDSGISSDGFQLLEDLQSELREKAHLAHQLRNQLDFTDRQHEEVLATLTAERDSLRGHLNMLREENITLSHVRRDYEEACDRLLASERALDDARRELEGSRRRSKLLAEQRAALESEEACDRLLASERALDDARRELEGSRRRSKLLAEQRAALESEVSAGDTSEPRAPRLRKPATACWPASGRWTTRAGSWRAPAGGASCWPSSEPRWRARSVQGTRASHVRRDYEEACDRLLASERALDDARRELEGSRRRSKLLAEQRAALESEEACDRLLASERALDDARRELEGSRRRSKLLAEQRAALESEEACDRLLASERALDDARRELEGSRRRSKLLAEQRAALESEVSAGDTSEPRAPRLRKPATACWPASGRWTTRAGSWRAPAGGASCWPSSEPRWRARSVQGTRASHVRRDYEEACDRLLASERALDDARRELEGSRRRSKLLAEQRAALESEVSAGDTSEPRAPRLRKPATGCWPASGRWTTRAGTWRAPAGGASCWPSSEPRWRARSVQGTRASHVRRDYEEACDRLLASERALDDARRELEGSRRRSKLLAEQRAALESEKLTLQELLTKSKDECHRINEMYASRQSALLEQNESLRAERAELAARLHDQEEVMQQLIKEKVLLEMELKDTVNKANQTPLRLDRSIDVSYCEDHALAALDSLTADSRFSPDISSVGTQVEVPCADCEKRKVIAPHRSLRKYFWDALKVMFQVFAVVCFACAVCVLYAFARPLAACRDPVPWRWLQPQDIMDLFLRIEYVADVPM